MQTFLCSTSGGSAHKETSWIKKLIERWRRSSKPYLCFHHVCRGGHPRDLPKPGEGFWLYMYFSKSKTDSEELRGKVFFRFHVIDWCHTDDRLLPPSYKKRTDLCFMEEKQNDSKMTWFICDQAQEFREALSIDDFGHPEGKRLLSAIRTVPGQVDVITEPEVSETWPAFHDRLTDSWFLLPEEREAQTPLLEGAVHRVSVNAYERNPEARRQCVAHHGATCCICGFNFGRVYGEVAEGYIHVHHLRPLSVVDGEYTVDPVEDLRPVCPNCHAVLHQENPAYTPEMVRAFLDDPRDG